MVSHNYRTKKIQLRCWVDESVYNGFKQLILIEKGNTYCYIGDAVTKLMKNLLDGEGGYTHTFFSTPVETRVGGSDFGWKVLSSPQRKLVTYLLNNKIEKLTRGEFISLCNGILSIKDTRSIFGNHYTYLKSIGVFKPLNWKKNNSNGYEIISISVNLLKIKELLDDYASKQKQ